MFDVGFSELLVIAVVALIVIGPERLPKVARTVGHLLGRLQRYVGDVKADIEREMRLEEMKKLQAEVEEQARGIESKVRNEMQGVGESLNATVQPLADAVHAADQTLNAEAASLTAVETLAPAAAPAPSVTPLAAPSATPALAAPGAVPTPVPAAEPATPESSKPA